MMRLSILVLTLLINVGSVSADPKSSLTHPCNLRGCIPPDAMSLALSKLYNLDRQTVSLEQLRTIWPTPIDAQDCDPGGCRAVWSKDRIISGQCQCCATFFFEVQGTNANPRTESLNNVVVNYTVVSEAALPRIAKQFAVALGLQESEIVDVLKNPTQSFHWQAKNGQLVFLEIRCIHARNEWELYLNTSHVNK